MLQSIRNKLTTSVLDRLKKQGAPSPANPSQPGIDLMGQDEEEQQPPQGDALPSDPSQSPEPISPEIEKSALNLPNVNRPMLKKKKKPLV